MQHPRTFIIMFAFCSLYAACTPKHTDVAQTRGPLEETTRGEVTREFVLLYSGQANPGSGWERQKEAFRSLTATWERRLQVTVSIKKGHGSTTYSLPISALGNLPGPVYIGPVSGGSMIGRGDEIANLPTSSGAMIMLRVDPSKSTLEWHE